MDLTTSRSLDLAAAARHRDAQILSVSPLRVVTPRACWAYAISLDLREAIRHDGGGGISLVVRLRVLRGRVGVGVTNEAGDAFLEEKFVAAPQEQATLSVRAGVVPGALVLRNADASVSESEFIVINAAWGPSVPPPYPVALAPRDFASETAPRDGDAVVFDDRAAEHINRARIDWIDAVGLPLDGRRVLDVGCGVGHFVQYYRSRGCTVTGLEGRAENVAVLRQRHPQVTAHVGDVQTFPLAALGGFDIVHCFGLLYHLESPVAALRNIHAACGELLLLETMVCDSSRPVAVLADETKSVNQALEGMGCRPSPTFVTLALNRVGFSYVYGTLSPPRHPDFEFDWRDNLDTSRDGHNLRCVFVASRSPIARPLLVPLLDR